MANLKVTNEVNRIFREYGSNYNVPNVIATLYLLNEKKNKYNNEASLIIEDTTLGESVVDKVMSTLKEIEINETEYKQFVKELLVTVNGRAGYSGSIDDVPVEVNNVILELLQIGNQDTILNVQSGYGQSLIDFSNVLHNTKTNSNLVGAEINPLNYVSSILISDLLEVEIDFRNMDVLKDEVPEFDKAFVFPPFGMVYPYVDFASNSTNDFSGLFDVRGDSEWMFIFRLLEGLKANGQIVSLVPLGLMFRYTSKKIRQYLVDRKLVEGIILLPEGILNTTSIATVLLVLSNDNNKIKFLDASECIKDEDARKKKVDYKKILNLYTTKALDVEYDELPAYSYSFNPGTYIGSKTINILYPKRIDEVANIAPGSQYTIAKFKDVVCEKSDYQLLTSSDIQNGLVDYDSLTYIEENTKLDKHALQENDIVVTTKSTKIKTFVARNLPNRKIIVTGGMIILRPNIDIINPTFLKIFLDSETGQKLMRSIMRGTYIKTVPIKEFKMLNISCPPMEEQERISKKYNSLLAMYSGIKQQLEDMQNELESFYETHSQEK